MTGFLRQFAVTEGVAECRHRLFRIVSGAGFTALIFLVLVMPVYAYMDHGGRISRDFAVVDKEGRDNDLVFLTWGGTGKKKERLTLFALCADGECDATTPEIDSALRGSLFDNDLTYNNYDAPILDVHLSQNDTDDCDKRMCWHSSTHRDQTELSSRCQPQPSLGSADRNTKACRWAVEIPGSRGDISHAPPVVDAEADRVFVATVDEGSGGSLWAFDLNGNLKGFFRPLTFDSNGSKPYKKKIKSGFYARPAVKTYSYKYSSGGTYTTQKGTLVFATGLKNSWLYVLDGRDLQTVIAAFPVSDDLDSGGGRVRFEPIVEDLNGACELEDHPGRRSCAFRIMMGVENGSKKRGLYVYNVTVEADSGGINAAGVVFKSALTLTPPHRELEYAVLNKALPMTLGGVVIEGMATESGTSVSKKFLIATLDHQAGTAVFDLSRAEANSGIHEGDAALAFFAVHPDIRATHRTHPTKAYEKEVCDPILTGTDLYKCSCEPGAIGCDPVVYIGQKEEAPKGGGQVWKFRLRSDPTWETVDLQGLSEVDGLAAKWNAIFEALWSGVDPSTVHGNPLGYTWPACLNGSKGSIPTTSWSSPVVHPEGRYVFVSSRNGSSRNAQGTGGIYQITQPQITSADSNACPDEIEAGSIMGDGQPDYLLDFYPKEGWRTTGIFTENQDFAGTTVEDDARKRYLLHYGSSHDKIYTIAPDVDSPSPSSVEGCDKVQWCYDIEARTSGLCDAGDAVDNGVADPVCCACTG
jgi:hypothetical protein